MKISCHSERSRRRRRSRRIYPGAPIWVGKILRLAPLAHDDNFRYAPKAFSLRRRCRAKRGGCGGRRSRLRIRRNLFTVERWYRTPHQSFVRSSQMTASPQGEALGIPVIARRGCNPDVAISLKPLRRVSNELPASRKLPWDGRFSPQGARSMVPSELTIRVVFFEKNFCKKIDKTACN